MRCAEIRCHVVGINKSFVVGEEVENTVKSKRQRTGVTEEKHAEKEPEELNLEEEEEEYEDSESDAEEGELSG